MTSEPAPPPLDELLARREWVRRFARTLARDDAAADDLAQDAWVAAVERPPRPDAPAGWFRRVVLRRAIDVARGERRRQTRENAASRPDRAPSAADVVAAAESHRRVVEAVMALEEPYRTTILLRFFEDLPPREVAARMGAPVETVRARVRRAVEKLRARLDEEHRGNRAAWLAPLLGETKPPTPRGATTAAAGRGLVMTTAQKTVAACALLALLFGGAWLVASAASSRSGDAATRSDARPESAAERSAHRRRRGRDAFEDETPPAVAPTTPAPAAAASSPGATDEDARPDHFDAYVVDPSHAPVDGVRVRIEVTDMGFQPVSEQGLSAVTDERGRAHFKVGSAVLSASADYVGADGRAWRPRRPWLATPGATRCELVVERASWIAGRALLEDGSPFPMAGIAAVDRGRRVAMTASDFDGRFKMIVAAEGTWDVVIDSSSAPSSQTVVAHAGGDAGAKDGPAAPERPWELVGEARGVASGAQGVSVVATRRTAARTLRVRATTTDGRPVVGVPIRLTGMGRRGEVSTAPRTGDDGCVAIPDVPDRRILASFWGDGPDAPPWESAGWIAPGASLLAPTGNEEFVIVFVPARPIRGRVEVPEGFEPVKDVKGRPIRASISVCDETTQRVWTSHADADGRFAAVCPADAAGPFTLLASFSGVGRFLQTTIADVRADAGEVVVRFPTK